MNDHRTRLSKPTYVQCIRCRMVMLVAQDTQDRPRCAGRVGILVARGIREETLGCCRELLTYRSCSDVRPSQVENINLVSVRRKGARIIRRIYSHDL